MLRQRCRREKSPEEDPEKFLILVNKYSIVQFSNQQGEQVYIDLWNDPNGLIGVLIFIKMYENTVHPQNYIEPKSEPIHDVCHLTFRLADMTMC